jgi:3-methyladenine DNA glycosylase AlkD
MAPRAIDADTIRSELIAGFRAAANPAKAAQQQAYMKTTMPFWGLTNAEGRKLSRAVFKRHPVTTKAQWLSVAQHLWRKATHREEWYATLTWTGIRAASVWQQPDVLPLYEEMITTSAWWDTVDELAAHRVGTLLANEPTKLKPTLLRWAKDADLWKRRTAILSQLTFKQDTDLDFLFATMRPSLERKEFWLRKAIGWALRQQAYFHAAEVLAFVREHKDVLSGLTKREALKHYPEKQRVALL